MMVKKRVLLSDHVKIRMLERSISEDTIQEVIKNPDYTTRSPEGKIKASKRIGGKTYAVIFIEDGNKIVVITTF